MADLPSITISGTSASDMQVCINGERVPGVQHFSVQMTAGEDTLPVVTLRVIGRSLDVDLPAVVLRAIEADAQPRLSMLHDNAGERMIAQLADQYLTLAPATRWALLRNLRLITSEENERAERDPAFGAVLDAAVIIRAVQADDDTMLTQLAGAVHTAYEAAAAAEVMT